MKTSLFAVLIAGSLTFGAQAKNAVYLEETFNAQEITSLQLSIPVGELELNTHKGDELIVEVKVTESDNSWFSSVSLDNATLESDQRGDELNLEVDIEDTKQTWTVTVPESLHLSINMGVGEVDIRGIAASLDLDLGVGDASIELADTNYHKIQLETGVGDAELAGFSNVRETRAMVSKDVAWKGNGEEELYVEVGVGDVEVSL